MSDAPQTLALITLAQQYRGDLVRQINRRTTLLKMLRILRGEGKNCAWAPQGSGHLAENYTDGQAAANFGSDAQLSATLAWGLYRSNFHVTKLAMDTAATSGSPLGNLALWGRNLLDASATLADAIETALFNGAGTGTTIAGLDVAIGDTTNTYATLARGSYSYWQPYVVDPGSATSITLKQIRTDIGTIFDNSGETPDLAVCPTAVFNVIAGLFDPNRRWTVVNTARGAVNLNAGYEGVEVDGCMFVKAKGATAGQIYYINTNHVHIEVLPSASVPDEVSRAVVPNDGFGAVPLGMVAEPLAKLGPASRAQVLAQLQLVVERPNSCGVRKNVATT